MPGNWPSGLRAAHWKIPQAQLKVCKNAAAGPDAPCQPCTMLLIPCCCPLWSADSRMPALSACCFNLLSRLQPKPIGGTKQGTQGCNNTSRNQVKWRPCDTLTLTSSTAFQLWRLTGHHVCTQVHVHMWQRLFEIPVAKAAQPLLNQHWEAFSWLAQRPCHDCNGSALASYWMYLAWLPSTVIVLRLAQILHKSMFAFVTTRNDVNRYSLW